jgi:hypothetical protein
MRYIKYSVITCLFFFLLGVSSTRINAIEIQKRDNLKIDETLSIQSEIYSYPQKIYISQLSGFNKNLSDKPEEWVKFLYYYSVTRLGLNDIPYNYLIDRSGKIYEGAKGGDGINPGLEGGNNVILIGIMDDNQALSPRLSSSLNVLVEDLSYKYGIKSDSWDFVELKLTKNENAVSFLTSSTSQSSIRNSITSSLAEVNWSDTEHLEYKGSIQSVEYPKEVEIGSRFDVKVKIKNENDFTWFGDQSYIYISTIDSVESPHSINQLWESFSKPTHIQNATIKPGEIGEVVFQMDAKSIPGEYKQSFYFTKSQDYVVDGTRFDVEFKIVKGSKKLIQLVSPEYGYVNIRECRWYSCKVLEVADDGQVYITTGKEEGWYIVQFGEGKTGWVYQKYAKEI